AEANMQMGSSSNVAPIFMCSLREPAGQSDAGVPFLASSLGTQRRRAMYVFLDSFLIQTSPV
ncbi:MAG: hypothetical protein ABUK11_09000, partial [Mariprofundaceae bacterium]